MRHIDLTKLTQVITVIAGLLTIDKLMGPVIAQWLNSNSAYFEIFLNSSTNSVSNNFTISSISNLTNWIPSITIPEFFNNNNIYYSDKATFIATVVIALIMVGLFLESGSYLGLSLVVMTIAIGIGFNLIYFITSFFVSDTWLVINTIVAAIFGSTIISDTKDAAKKDVRQSFFDWLVGVFIVLLILLMFEIIIKFVYYIIILILYYISHLFTSVIGSLGSIC